MSKETIRKATLEDLIAKAVQKENDKKKVKEILTVVNGEEVSLTFVKPSQSVVLDAMEDIGEGDDIKMVVQTFTHLIYECCPMLQNADLQKGLNILDPYDTVSKLFELGEIMKIGNQLSDLIGLNAISDTVKN